MGKPIRGARRFLTKVALPAGTMCAVLTTEAAPQPDKRTGRVPTPEETAKWQRVRPIIDEILGSKGLVKVAEGCVQVTGLEGPLEERWEQKVAEFAAASPSRPERRPLPSRRPTPRLLQAPGPLPS
jgi:hypothetical protein